MVFDMLFLLLFGFCHSAPHEGLPLLNPGGIGGIFEGPGSETIIRGPDGSEITSEQKSGAIIRDDALSNQPIVVAEPKIVAPPPVLTDERIIQTGPAGSPPASLLIGETYDTAGQAYINDGPVISSTAAPILASGAQQLASAAPILSSSPGPLLPGETYGQGYIDVQPISQSVAPNLQISEAPIQSLAPPASAEPAIAVAPINIKPVEIVEQDPHIIETEIIEAPAVETDESVDIKGSSGRIITKGSASIVSGPASTTITEPRKIIVAPPKIAIGTPVVATATIPIKNTPLLPLSAVSYSTGASVSAAASPALSYSTTAAPIDLGYSTTAAPLISVSSTAGIDSRRIDLGAGNLRESIPVVEYSASNGVINEQNLASVDGYYSTEAPATISSTISTINTGNFGTSESPVVPATYLLPPAAPTNAGSTGAGSISSIASYNIQKITRIEDSIGVDGRVDMGDLPYQKPSSKDYQLPQVLSMALSRFYRKSPRENKNTVLVDDKLGESAQNEISSSFLSAPDLSEARYIAPVLARNGIDASQVNLASIPLSQVRRLPDGYRSAINGGPLTNNYYKRSANPRK